MVKHRIVSEQKTEI